MARSSNDKGSNVLGEDSVILSDGNGPLFTDEGVKGRCTVSRASEGEASSAEGDGNLHRKSLSSTDWIERKMLTECWGEMVNAADEEGGCGRAC